ncbi:hypothetical protein GQR58_028512 [Nymphon striatum]|nr:hypothetical protein GQR58_028512 [Nymphon striatum]
MSSASNWPSPSTCRIQSCSGLERSAVGIEHGGSVAAVDLVGLGNDGASEFGVESFDDFHGVVGGHVVHDHEPVLVAAVVEHGVHVSQESSDAIGLVIGRNSESYRGHPASGGDSRCCVRFGRHVNFLGARLPPQLERREQQGAVAAAGAAAERSTPSLAERLRAEADRVGDAAAAAADAGPGSLEP